MMMAMMAVRVVPEVERVVTEGGIGIDNDGDRKGQQNW